MRVGLGAIKGLAEASGKPIATVSLLEALASLAEVEGTVAAALDAGRNEIYFGLYFAHPAENNTTLIDESLRSQAELLEQLEIHPEATLITSDEAIATLASGGTTRTELVQRPDSALIGRLGLRKLLAGDTVAVEELDANYIRRSDAEIFHKGNTDLKRDTAFGHSRKTSPGCWKLPGKSPPRHTGRQPTMKIYLHQTWCSKAACWWPRQPEAVDGFLVARGLGW